MGGRACLSGKTCVAATDWLYMINMTGPHMDDVIYPKKLNIGDIGFRWRSPKQMNYSKHIFRGNLTRIKKMESKLTDACF